MKRERKQIKTNLLISKYTITFIGRYTMFKSQMY